MSIEIEATIELCDDGEIWVRSKDGNQCIHGRQKTQRESTLETLLGIFERHALNRIAVAKQDGSEEETEDDDDDGE